MKKFIYSCLFLAMAAITFSSCEDVPAPYNMPTEDETPEVQPAGTGTAAVGLSLASSPGLIRKNSGPVPTSTEKNGAGVTGSVLSRKCCGWVRSAARGRDARSAPSGSGRAARPRAARTGRHTRPATRHWQRTAAAGRHRRR